MVTYTEALSNCPLDYFYRLFGRLLIPETRVTSHDGSVCPPLQRFPYINAALNGHNALCTDKLLY